MLFLVAGINAHCLVSEVKRKGDFSLMEEKYSELFKIKHIMDKENKDFSKFLEEYSSDFDKTETLVNGEKYTTQMLDMFKLQIPRMEKAMDELNIDLNSALSCESFILLAERERLSKLLDIPLDDDQVESVTQVYAKMDDNEKQTLTNYFDCINPLESEYDKNSNEEIYGLVNPNEKMIVGLTLNARNYVDEVISESSFDCEMSD